MENVSLEELKVNNPDTVPEVPTRLTLLKLSLELAYAENGTANRNKAQMQASLEKRLMALLTTYRLTTGVSLYLSQSLSRLIISATGCKPLQHHRKP